MCMLHRTPSFRKYSKIELASQQLLNFSAGFAPPEVWIFLRSGSRRLVSLRTLGILPIIHLLSFIDSDPFITGASDQNDSHSHRRCNNIVG